VDGALVGAGSLCEGQSDPTASSAPWWMDGWMDGGWTGSTFSLGSSSLANLAACISVLWPSKNPWALSNVQIMDFFCSYFQFCDIKILVKFSKRLAKLTKFTIEKKKFPKIYLIFWS
jgi:hypothetical protein